MAERFINQQLVQAPVASSSVGTMHFENGPIDCSLSQVVQAPARVPRSKRCQTMARAWCPAETRKFATTIAPFFWTVLAWNRRTSSCGCQFG